MANTFLVIGATGKQGGAVIEALLASPASTDITIFALTRNPESGSAKALISKAPEKIKLIRGDLNDSSAIFSAAAVPIQGVFCISIPPLGPGSKADSEEVNSKALVDAALDHGVKHFVFTSVDRHGSDSESNDTDVPSFIAKSRIERHLREKSAGKMTWTILRPTAFMDNITTGFAGKIFPTAWKVGLPPTTKLQLIACVDIGYFGAQALRHPKEFAGRGISLAGDELTFEQANTIFHEKFGKDIPTTYGFVGSGLLWAVKDVGLMFEFFKDVGYGSDIKALRNEHPGLLSLGDWLETQKAVFAPAGNN
jgi:uncharacterized protein YbjT (DUF2867 family)